MLQYLYLQNIHKLNKIRMVYSQLHCIGGHDASNRSIDMLQQFRWGS